MEPHTNHGNEESPKPTAGMVPSVLALLAWLSLTIGMILFAVLFPSEHFERSRWELALLGAGLWFFAGIVLATILLVAREVLPYLRRTPEGTAKLSGKNGAAQ
jgi:hypothetical protein